MHVSPRARGKATLQSIEVRVHIDLKPSIRLNLSLKGGESIRAKLRRTFGRSLSSLRLLGFCMPFQA